MLIKSSYAHRGYRSLCPLHYLLENRRRQEKPQMVAHKWSLIPLVTMVALTLIALPVLHGGQDFLLDITKGNIHATHHSQLHLITCARCANRLSYLLQLY